MTALPPNAVSHSGQGLAKSNRLGFGERLAVRPCTGVFGWAAGFMQLRLGSNGLGMQAQCARLLVARAANGHIKQGLTILFAGHPVRLTQGNFVAVPAIELHKRKCSKVNAEDDLLRNVFFMINNLQGIRCAVPGARINRGQLPVS